MELYSGNENYKLYHGNMLDMSEVVEKNTIDSIVCDPPYELNFMGKGWDNSGIAFQADTWRKCLEVLKPGGYLLAFGGSRTYHRIACAIEDAGFEIRDCIMWLYGSGFPKSMNIGLAIDKKNGVESEVVGEGKSGVSSRAYQSEEQTTAGEYQIKKASNEWNGWGTALKPSYEPIIVARKPLEGSCTDNVIKYGVGGINIDECRVPTEDKLSIHSSGGQGIYGRNSYFKSKTKAQSHTTDEQLLGRFPANTILTYGENDKEEVCGGFPNTKGGSPINFDNVKKQKIYGGNSLLESKTKGIGYYVGFNDSGSASRYFYCAKASKRDRDEGLDEFKEKEIQTNMQSAGKDHYRLDHQPVPLRKNIHPTVKPTDLMQYLVRLVTPNGGTVLDPFNGSGSTGKAVMYENKDRNKNYKYIGIELTDEYLPIAKARIEYLMGNEIKIKSGEQELQNESREKSLFDF